MHSYAAEVVAKSLLEEGARACVQRLSGCTDDSTHRSGRLASGGSGHRGRQGPQWTCFFPFIQVTFWDVHAHNVIGDAVRRAL
jgi:hypothetical protein